MTATPRAASLKASLLRELDSISQREDFDHLRRLAWLRDELENYLDRWLAFAAVESIPMKSLLRDDLFMMVLVASEVYSEQLEGGGCDIGTAEWAHFRSMLSRVRSTKDRSSLLGLRDALVAVGATIHEKRD